jgi:hypothetical protein
MAPGFGVELQTMLFLFSMLTVKNPSFGDGDEDNDTDWTIAKRKDTYEVNT